MRTIVVVPYQPGWAVRFERHKAELSAALGDYALAIEHVGSTAVVGLWAKPIIDIDVVIEDMSTFGAVCEALAKIGYTYEGDQGIPGREAFKRAEYPTRSHHLYVCPKDSEELHRHLVFRDHLRTHVEDCYAYTRAKREAAKAYPHDIDAYIAYKGRTIETIYRKCGLL